MRRYRLMHMGSEGFFEEGGGDRPLYLGSEGIATEEDTGIYLVLDTETWEQVSMTPEEFKAANKTAIDDMKEAMDHGQDV